MSVLQRIAFAKSKSDATAKLDGTYVERKKKREEGLCIWVFNIITH